MGSRESWPPKTGLHGSVRNRNPIFATRLISSIASATSDVMIAAAGDMKSLYSPYISQAKSFQTRHCAIPNAASLVANIIKPLFGKMISASMPSRI